MAETGIAAPDCGPPGEASAEFWIEPRTEGDFGPLDCVVDDVRLASDDLDIEIDLDCGATTDPGADTGATPAVSTIKLAPTAARPDVAIDEAVVFAGVREQVYCDESLSFSLHRADGRLVAAGAMPTKLTTTIDTGAAETLTLERTSDDEGCGRVNATLGAASAQLYGGDTVTLVSGDTRLQIDVGRMRNPQSYGDDCGGTATYYDVIVTRLE
jgi:hypothetical protein